MDKGNRPSVGIYILIAVIIFSISIIISIIARCVLMVDSKVFFFNEEQVLLIAGMIEGAVGAIAAAFVLYQLKSNHNVELRENEIHEAEFYQHFINYWIETDKLFIQYPECRKYFYEDADVSGLDPMSEEYQRVMGIAEYFDDLFRYSETQVSNKTVFGASIPEEQVESYIRYISSMRAKPVFVHYKEKYGQWVNSTHRYQIEKNN